MADGVPKVLVVDDYAPNRLIYGDWLRVIKGIEIVEANGGQQALELARAHDFAMVLLDINMPDMDGFELASRLRHEPRAELTPIVFVTSEATERRYLMRGYRMGAVDFMVSAPVHGEILAQKARVFIQMFRKRQELQDAVDRARRENQELHTRLEEFIRQQETLRAQATHDALTRLPNRTLFQDRLEAAIRRARRNKQRFAVAHVDLDGFKAVNDRHGHATGDALIVSCAERLTRAIRATDTIARLGADEFAVLFEGLDSVAGASTVADKVHKVLTAPASLGSGLGAAAVEVCTGASIGVAVYPDHAQDGSELVTLADLTRYAAKRAGGGARLYAGDLAEARGELPSHLHLVRNRDGNDA